MSEQCCNCKYALETKPGNWNCRRFPPHPVSFVNEYGEDPQTGARVLLSYGAFIGVNHDWWCGEWKPRQTN